MIVPDQKNIKVHFAGLETLHHLLIVDAADINYCLFTVYPYIRKKNKLEDIQQSDMPIIAQEKFRHCIMDSGLFTLMFGSEKGEKSESFLSFWTDKILKFMEVSNYTGTYVEVDCQKVLGVEQAWKYRQYMKENSKNRQINVFHFEDGQKGLDRLIEYSDYIALSIPELRLLKKKDYTYRLANYIKNKKPEIDIHLLGCTEYKMLKQLSFCSSSDSTSWLACQIYGQLSLDTKRPTKNLDKVKIINRYKEKIESFTKYRGVNKITDTTYFYAASSILQCEYLKNKYERFGGDQN